MSRISYFQRFSQAENHATNNTLLILRCFYQASPFKLQRVLSSLLETDLSIGLSFEQQVRGTHGIPDALISQEALRIFVETKRGDSVDPAQIKRHFQSIAAGASSGARGDVLIALTKEPIADGVRKSLAATGAEQGISFAAVTFTQIVEALRQQCADLERELIAIVEDYDSYLAEENLVEERNQWLVVFPCGTSFAENARFGLYYEPPTRPCKRNYRFIGIYKWKTVSYVGTVEAIAVASYDDKTGYAFDVEAGDLTQAHRKRIEEAIDATPYYDIKYESHRYYLVDHFQETSARKTSPGGIMGLRYLDLSKLISSYNPRKIYSTDEMATALKDTTWE